MEKAERNKLKSFIQAHKDENEIIEKLDDIDTELDLDGGTALAHAVNYQKTDVVRYLIDKGADVNANISDYTPLISACESGSSEIVNMLLEAGADISVKDSFGNNALQKASFYEHTDILEMLMEKGADPYEEFKNGVSVYQSAQRMEREKSIAVFDKYKK